MPTRYDQAQTQRLLAGLVDQIARGFDPKQPLIIVGIRTRGETIAQRITPLLTERGFSQIHRGVLDITLYRDDLSEVGPLPLVRPTKIDVDINGKPLLLVDDVLFTGRTVRAALDALRDFGRPSAIRLAALVDRGGRELPIQADFVGLVNKDVPITHRVKVKLSETDGAEEIVIEPRDADRRPQS
jgi:pyrimidine operon attenuation protein / uracil phosphoribosyltransferase